MGMMPPAAGTGVPPIGAPAMPPLGTMPQMSNQQAPMSPEQYQQFYQQWTDMMSKMQQAPATAAPAETQ